MLDMVKGMAIVRCLAGFPLGIVIYALRERIAVWPDATLSALQIAGLGPVLSTMILGLNDVLVMPGFVMLIAATWPDRGWLTAPLKSTPLHWLGEISYSVYLDHFWVLSGWQFVTKRIADALHLSDSIERSTMLAGSVALVSIVSHITYRFIEKPARKAIVGAYRGRHAHADSSALHPDKGLT